MTMTPANEAELAELIAARHAARAPLRITGGGTRVQMAHLAAEDHQLIQLDAPFQQQ